MAGPWRLAAVPEGSTDGAKADQPPVGLYRNRIQAVDVSVGRRRSTIFSHGGSSYSSVSNSCPSSKSGYSSGSASAAGLECFRNQEELTRIARQMVIDGYTQRMAQAFDDASPAPAFKFGGSPDHALTSWFSELDVDWVLQIHDENSLRRLLRDKPATTRDLVDKWIRALAVIVASITDLLFDVETPAAVVPFGKASIAQMLDVVDVIITVLEAEKLQLVLDIFTCVSDALHVFTSLVLSPEINSIFSGIRSLLERQENRLSKNIASTMQELRTLMDEDDSWALEISRGGGEVHKNTRFIMDCIVSMMNAQTSSQNSLPSRSSENLSIEIDITTEYLKGLLFRKSESCSDQSLRYLFLLNNSYFIAQVSDPSGDNYGLKLTPECEKYMDSYLDASWGHVLPCIQKSFFPGLLCCWCCCINTSSLAKFESAFHQTYEAQKFWKVPDPQLRDELRRAITRKVISEHPGIEQHVSRRSGSPKALVWMLEQIFEG